MKPDLLNPITKRWFFAWLVATLLLGACSAPSEATPVPHEIPTHPTSSLALPTPTDAFPDIPNEARIATRAGDPRPAAYWALWNTCAPENRADIAAANGGRVAGWILMDDLLADPGIQLGDYRITTCAQGLALLEGRTATGEETDDPIFDLASVLLAAELNLNAAAETCPIAEEAVTGGHIILSEAGFNGIETYVAATSSEIVSAIPRLVELIAGYNRGELCR